MRTSLVLPFLLACACASPTSGSRSSAAAASAISAAPGPAATARIEPRSGSNLSGSATFAAIQDGLGIHVELQDAAPGLHGVHLHEKGSCDGPDAASAGAHYDPDGGAHHGGPSTRVRHAGDLGNIQVGSNGRGTLDVVVPDLSVNSLQNGVVGRAIVVHAKADDLQTDPTGNSDARLGCGVIMAPSLQ